MARGRAGDQPEEGSLAPKLTMSHTRACVEGSPSCASGSMRRRKGMRREDQTGEWRIPRRTTGRATGKSPRGGRGARLGPDIAGDSSNTASPKKYKMESRESANLKSEDARDATASKIREKGR